MLSAVLLLPIIAIMFSNRNIIRTTALIELFIILFIFTQYNIMLAGYQFVSEIPMLHIKLGVDGISMVLMLLHSICFFVSIPDDKTNNTLYLILISLIYGVIIFMNLLAIVIIYIISVIIIYTITYKWHTNKEKLMFLIYVTGGSILLFSGILLLYLVSKINTFDILGLFDIPGLEMYLKNILMDINIQKKLVVLFIAGIIITNPLTCKRFFNVRYPLFITLIHSIVSLELLVYSIIKLMVSLVPLGAIFWTPFFITFSALLTFTCGVIALKQKDSLKIIECLFINQIGYIIMGIFSLTSNGINGAVLLTLLDGIIITLAILLPRNLPLGLAKIGYGAVFFTISGIPGFANFYAYVLIFSSIWHLYKLQVLISISGILMIAMSLLRHQKTISQNVENHKLHIWKLLSYILLIFAIIICGLFPKPLINIINSASTEILL